MDELIDGVEYRKILASAIGQIKKFKPHFLIVALGPDTAKGDPAGTRRLTPGDFEKNGGMIGSLNLPTLIVQEGGYKTQTLGLNARAFFTGFAQTHNIHSTRMKNIG